MCVECDTVERANKLVQTAYACGLRESGIGYAGKRVIATLRSNLKMEAPIAVDGKCLVDEHYLRFLTQQANHKFGMNWKKTQLFHQNFLRAFGGAREEQEEGHHRGVSPIENDGAEGRGKHMAAIVTSKECCLEPHREEKIEETPSQEEVEPLFGMNPQVETVDESNRNSQDLLVDEKYAADETESKLKDLNSRSNWQLSSALKIYHSALQSSPAQSTLVKGWALLTEKKFTKFIKDCLKDRKWLDRTRQISTLAQVFELQFSDHKEVQASLSEEQLHCLSDLVIVPVLPEGVRSCQKFSSLSTSLSLAEHGISDQSLLLHQIELPAVLKQKKSQRAAPSTLDQKIDTQHVAGDNNSSNFGNDTPYQALRAAVEELLLRHNLALSLANNVPKKWEILGDLVLLPATSFSSSQWQAVLQESPEKHNQKRKQDEDNETDTFALQLWKTVAKALKVARVARQQEIKQGPKRRSQVAMLLGKDGWVKHKENGVWYCFDVTKCMFASGNGTERKRMGQVCQEGEVVLDLYSGIGYFTLSALVHSKIKHLHACEWNEDAAAALRFNLKENGISAERYSVHEGDNRKLQLENAVDRVFLGLLPSAVDGFPVAIRALKSRGGWLHVHENVVETKAKEWANLLVQQLQALARKSSNPEKIKWSVSNTLLSVFFLLFFYLLT